MKDAFRESFIRHVNEFGSKVADLEGGTGVPRSIINKLLRRENRTTNVEDAMAIAHYYGKSLEEFIGGNTGSNTVALSALLSFLTDEELSMFVAQIKGVVADRDQAKKPQRPRVGV